MGPGGNAELKGISATIGPGLLQALSAVRRTNVLAITPLSGARSEPPDFKASTMVDGLLGLWPSPSSQDGVRIACCESEPAALTA